MPCAVGSAQEDEEKRLLEKEKRDGGAEAGESASAIEEGVEA